MLQVVVDFKLSKPPRIKVPTPVPTNVSVSVIRDITDTSHAPVLAPNAPPPLPPPPPTQSKERTLE